MESNMKTRLQSRFSLYKCIGHLRLRRLEELHAVCSTFIVYAPQRSQQNVGGFFDLIKDIHIAAFVRMILDCLLSVRLLDLIHICMLVDAQ